MFHGNIRIKDGNPTILELRKIYMRICNIPEEMFMLLLLDAICGDEDDTEDLSLRSKEVEGKQRLINTLTTEEDLIEGKSALS